MSQTTNVKREDGEEQKFQETRRSSDERKSKKHSLLKAPPTTFEVKTTIKPSPTPEGSKTQY